MATTEARQRGMSIFRAADAQDFMAAGVMAAPTVADDARAPFGEVVAAGSGTGAEVKVLTRQPTDAGGFQLVRLWFKPNYPLPRHSHDVDCLYYVLSGSLTMGNQTLRPGDGFFVPADAPYQYDAGPDGVEVLEIRHDVGVFDMQIPDIGAARWAAMLTTVEANRDAWKAMTASPTTLANQQA